MEITAEKQIAKGFEKYNEEGKYLNPTRTGVVTEDYVLKKVEYIFSNYVRGNDAIKYSSRGDFTLLRQFAAGKQPEERYFPYFYGSTYNGSGRTFNNLGVDVGGISEEAFNSKDWARKALGHINWQIMSPMPKIMNKILSSFYGNSYDINIECVDENSISEQEQKKWTAYVQSQADYIAFMQEVSAAAGVPYSPPEKRIETIEELELHEASGGFKLNYAKEGEKVIKDAWNISNEEELNEKIVKDIATINVGAYRVYYDREIGKEMFRYVDPANAGIQYSKYNDFRDSSYAYEWYLVPAYKLQSYGIDVKDIPSVASNYGGQFGNPDWDEAFMKPEATNTELKCGFFKVPVVDVEWIDVDVEEDVIYTSKYGQKRIRKYEKGEQLSANKQYLPTKIHKVYQAKWVIGTDIIYEWGLKPNQPKRNKNQSVLSFHFIKGKTDQSIVEQLMPVLDNFQLNWLKLQDAIASAVKAGYAYEYESLSGMKMGGAKLDPMDMIKMHRVTGSILFTRRNRHQANVSSKPIEALVDNTAQTINSFVVGLDLSAKMIEEITGINPVALGSSADPRAGKAVTEIAVSSSAAPIKNIFDKTFQLKEHASLDLLQRVQLDLRNSPTVRERYKAVIGAFGVQTLIEAEGKGVQFGSNLVAKPTQEDMDRIMAFVDVALSNGRNGVTGLTIPDALYILGKLRNGGNLKEVELYIGYKLKKADEAAQAAAQAAAQQQIEGQQQGIAMKAQVDLQNAQIDIERSNIEAEAKAYYQIAVDNNASANKIREIKAQAGIYDPVAPPAPIAVPDTVLDAQSAQMTAEQAMAQE